MLFRLTSCSILSRSLLVHVSSPSSRGRVRNLWTKAATIYRGGAHLCIFSSPRGIDLTFYRNILLSYVVWLSATRTAKLLPHLWNRPQDIIYVPAFILFGYYFAVMKLYALLTLHEVGVLAFVTLPTALTHVVDRLGYSRWCR